MSYNIKDGNDLALAATDINTLCGLMSDLINSIEFKDFERMSETLTRVNLLVSYMEPIAKELENITTAHLWKSVEQTATEAVNE